MYIFVVIDTLQISAFGTNYEVEGLPYFDIREKTTKKLQTMVFKGNAVLSKLRQFYFYVYVYDTYYAIYL